MSEFHETREWKIGDSAQKKWARMMAKRGHVVLPTYGMVEQDAKCKAPLIFVDTTALVAPDMLLMARMVQWHEVKAKAVATWRRYPPGPRWEHGIDFSLLEEYQTVAKKSESPVILVIHEEKSPLDDNEESPIDGPPKWLFISLADVFTYGDHRKDWPGGKFKADRGRRGKGGWLWPRNKMSQFNIR